MSTFIFMSVATPIFFLIAACRNSRSIQFRSVGRRRTRDFGLTSRDKQFDRG